MVVMVRWRCWWSCGGCRIVVLDVVVARLYWRSGGVSAGSGRMLAVVMVGWWWLWRLRVVAVMMAMGWRR